MLVLVPPEGRVNKGLEGLGDDDDDDDDDDRVCGY